MLEIKDLTVTVDTKPIIKNFNLTIRPGEIHAIMGPNGAGKSTLAKVIAGHPAYEVIGGDILFEGKSILDLDPEERAYMGIFMSFQYPVEIPGVNTAQFLRIAYNSNKKALGQKELSEKEFDELLQIKMALMEIKPEFKQRNVNEGYSGGEKKRNEILQMAVLEPKFSILDETDSGLDIDAMKIVARGVNKLQSKEKSLLLITHYQRLLDYIKPHHIHVMIDGKIVLSGGPELALELENKGYDWLEKSPEPETEHAR
jgi:Fe-S cluster assembly ATP-binding protein